MELRLCNFSSTNSSMKLRRFGLREDFGGCGFLLGTLTVPMAMRHLNIMREESPLRRAHDETLPKSSMTATLATADVKRAQPRHVLHASVRENARGTISWLVRSGFQNSVLGKNFEALDARVSQLGRAGRTRSHSEITRYSSESVSKRWPPVMRHGGRRFGEQQAAARIDWESHAGPERAG